MLPAMAARDAYLDRLAAVPLFRSFSKADLRKVARAGTEVRVDQGYVLAREGTTGRETFVILDGTASVRRNNRKVATLGSGEAVGELALLDHGPRTATVTAESPMTVLVLEPREFRAALDDVPRLSHKLLENLAGRVRQLDKQAYG